MAESEDGERRPWPHSRSAHGDWPAWLDEDDFDGLGEEAWRAAMESLAEEGPTASDELTLAGWPDDADLPGAEGEAGPARSGTRDGHPYDDHPYDDGSWQDAEGGDTPVLGFGPGDAGESMAPGVSLGMLTEDAVTGDGLSSMSDYEVVGLVAAARRLRCRAQWLELRGTREFTRRRWETGTEPVRDANGRWLFRNSPAEHAADELAFQLADSRAQAEDRMDLSVALDDRLPRMYALMAAGRLDERRAQAVADMTAGLTDEQARQVDELLAPDAPDLPYTALRRRAAKLVISVNPEAERKRRERATRRKARVEKFLERSGNYALAVREMPAEEILASEQHIRGLASYLRRHGVKLSQREAEVMVYLDLTQGRDPLDRIPPDRRDRTSAPTGPAPDASRDQRDEQDEQGEPGQGDESCHDESCHDESQQDDGWRDGPWDDYDEDYDEDEDEDEDQDKAGAEDGGDSGRGDGGNGGAGGGNDGDGGGGGPGPWPFSPPGPGRPGGRAPFAATINLLVPVGTAFGWSAMPGEAGRDIIGPQALRDMMQAASRQPATRWCVTLVGGDGTAVAHGCAQGQHRWDPPPDPGRSTTTSTTTTSTTTTSTTPGQEPTAAQAAALAEFLARLKIAVEPIAKGTCDHRHAEPRYRPSRKLGHLIRARNATCPAPGCEASSCHCDLDHTTPWPDGPTDECNIGPPCRHHHRTKQASGWTLEQPEPGVFHWTTPSGRTYETRPTRYDT